MICKSKKSIYLILTNISYVFSHLQVINCSEYKKQLSIANDINTDLVR